MDFDKLREIRNSLLDCESKDVKFAYVEELHDRWHIVYRTERRLRTADLLSVERLVTSFNQKAGFSTLEIGYSDLLLQCFCKISEPKREVQCEAPLRSNDIELQEIPPDQDRQNCMGDSRTATISSVTPSSYAAIIDGTGPSDTSPVPQKQFPVPPGVPVMASARSPFDLNVSGRILTHNNKFTYPADTSDLYILSKLNTSELFNAVRKLLSLHPFNETGYRYGVSFIVLWQVLVKYDFNFSVNQLSHYYFKYLYMHGVPGFYVARDLLNYKWKLMP